MEEKQVYSVFDIDGLLSQKLSKFEFREDQLNMALDVNDCYSSDSIAAIEAGTGIGKSFAYLAPALEYAFENPKDRTVIATSTINLQKQLMEKDIPALFEAFGKTCKVALAVGRNNYLCLRRLNAEAQSMQLLSSDSTTSLAKMIEFANSSETGLRTDYKERLDYDLWNSVCSDNELCMGSRCPYFQDCFYFKSKKILSEASIIICNHHLLFIDSNTRYKTQEDYSSDCILPPFNRLVIDEAHNIERHATDLFTSEYSNLDFRHQSEFIYNPRSKNVTKTGMLEEMASFSNNPEFVTKCKESLALVNSDADTINAAILDRLNINGLVHVLLVKENAPKFFMSVMPLINRMLENGRILIKNLMGFASSLKLTEDNQQRISDFKVLISRLTDVLKELAVFVDFAKWNEDVHYLETEKRAGVNYVFFRIAPLDVSKILRQALFLKIGSIVCTSATLDLKDDFAYWSASVGLPVEGKRFIKKVYSSPFDYKNRLMLLTPYDAPDFDKDKQEEYAMFLTSTIEKAVESAGGGSLILFTSIKLMDYCYTSLKNVFESHGMTTLKQGDLDRYSLLEKFKTDTDSVLFATNSFWEGVDAPGNTLRLVIITKLPFRMPDDPIYKARLSKLESDGKSGFFTLSLPDATMKLKQGFGRLMRHTSDKGIVLILDSRVVSKGYGVMMISSLPESYHPETETASLSEKIENFLY